MRSLGLLAARALEAGWLATALLIPLFMNKNGSGVFEPAKAGVLRALALFMLVAWAIAALGRSARDAGPAAADASSLSRTLRHPIALAAYALFGTALLSTLLSLAPLDSVWGAYDRAYGSATLLAHAAIFAATIVHLRSRAQIERLLTALLLPSIPIALYAIFQRMGFEPLRIAARETEVERAVSLLGQPVALAAYLTMLVPFTVLRLRGLLAETSAKWGRRALLAAPYAALLALQCTAAVFTESRGALLGLACAGAVGFLAVAAVRGLRRGVLALAAAAALAALLLVPSWLGTGGAEQSRFERRMAATLAVEGSGGKFRMTTWNVAARVLRHDEALELANGERDSLPQVRALVGYGPETQYGVAPAFYDAELPQLFGYFLIDRYHNELWDALLTTGALGLLAVLALQSLLTFFIVRGIGLLGTKRRVIALCASYAGGALLGALGWVSYLGLPYVFLGLQTGAVLGLLLFFFGCAVLAKRERATEVGAEGGALLVAALAALVNHAIEVSFSFTLVSTGMLFWTVCALVVVTLRAQTEGATRAEAAPAPSRALSPPSGADGALLTLMLIALGFAFLGGTAPATRAGDVLWDGLTLLSQPAAKRAPVVAAIVGATLLLGALLLAIDARGGALSIARRMTRTLAWALGLGFVYWLRSAFLVAEFAKPVRSDALLLSHNLALRTAWTSWFYLSALLAILLWAASSFLAEPRPPPPARPLARAPLRGLAALACAIAGAVLVLFGSLRPAAAECAAALGHGLAAQNRLGLAQQAFERAIELHPQLGAYRAMLAKVHAKRARAEPPHADEWYEKAEAALHEALARSPIATEHTTNLASIRSSWAQRSAPARRTELAAAVPALYARALRLNPMDPALWRLWAGAQLGLQDNPAAALQSARRSLALEPKQPATLALIADCQVARARMLAGEARREAFLAAADSYGSAAALAPRDAAHRIHEGQAYLEAGEPKRAVVALRAGLAMLPSRSPARSSATQVLRRAESALALVSGADAR